MRSATYKALLAIIAAIITSVQANLDLPCFEESKEYAKRIIGQVPSRELVRMPPRVGCEIQPTRVTRMQIDLVKDLDWKLNLSPKEFGEIQRWAKKYYEDEEYARSLNASAQTPSYELFSF